MTKANPGVHQKLLAFGPAGRFAAGWYRADHSQCRMLSFRMALILTGSCLPFARSEAPISHCVRLPRRATRRRTKPLLAPRRYRP